MNAVHSFALMWTVLLASAKEATMASGSSEIFRMILLPCDWSAKAGPVSKTNTWDSWRTRHAALGATAIYFLVLCLTARHVSPRAHKHEPHTSHGLVMSC